MRSERRPTSDMKYFGKKYAGVTAFMIME